MIMNLKSELLSDYWWGAISSLLTIQSPVTHVRYLVGGSRGLCAADYTCIQKGIAWTPVQLPVTHTNARKKMVGQKRQESVCSPNKIDCDMYSNMHRLKASSPACDTFSRQNNEDRSEKEAVCMRQNENGSCAVDHTCIQIGIAWTAPQVLLTHTHAKTKTQEQKKSSQSEKAGVCMRQKRKECARQIIQVFQ